MKLKSFWVVKGKRCFYCNRRVPLTEATKDHVLPLKLGGKGDKYNLVLACRPCNERKGADVPVPVGENQLHRKNRRAMLTGNIKKAMEGTFAPVVVQ